MSDINNMSESKVKMLDELMCIEQQFENRTEHKAQAKYNKQ